jgi:hypothetical protein
MFYYKNWVSFHQRLLVSPLRSFSSRGLPGNVAQSPMVMTRTKVRSHFSSFPFSLFFFFGLFLIPDTTRLSSSLPVLDACMPALCPGNRQDPSLIYVRYIPNEEVTISQRKNMRSKKTLALERKTFQPCFLMHISLVLVSCLL